MDIEHLSNNVAIMYPATKNAATRKGKKMGSHLETFTLKVENNVKSTTILNFSYLPPSSMNNPFNNVENKKKNKQFQ